MTKRDEAFEAMRKALGVLIEEAATISKDEACDHAVGICWCSYFEALDASRAALRLAEEGERG
jgi:hypothetical protein